MLAFFDTVARAGGAAAFVREWGRTDPAIEVGAVAVLVKDWEGALKTRKVGTRQTKLGAEIGVALGVLAAMASGGMTLLKGVAVGGLGGSVVGFLFHKGLAMSKVETDRIAWRLYDDRAAVGVVVPVVHSQFSMAFVRGLEVA